MQILLNGNPKIITKPMTIARLLEDLLVPATAIVIELNKTILQPDCYATTFLKDNDQMEIIRFVGGG
jgi:thiamine biosynthesis protein ThiS